MTEGGTELSSDPCLDLTDFSRKVYGSSLPTVTTMLSYQETMWLLCANVKAAQWADELLWADSHTGSQFGHQTLAESWLSSLWWLGTITVIF